MRDVMRDEVEMGSAPIVVLGLGNVLRRDEGLGIRALQRLQARYDFSGEVQLVDGGTLGLELLAYLEDARRLLVLDAALTEGPPGTVIRLAGEDVPAFLGMRSSPHEIGLADLLAVLRLRGLEPGEVVVLGMQPEVIELGWELSPTVSAQLDLLVEMTTNELKRWGVTLIAQDSTQMEATACTK
jgi:hydrogenase maturation protease